MVTILAAIDTCASPIATERASETPLDTTILPVPATTSSLNVSTMSSLTLAEVELSLGVEDASTGGVLSTNTTLRVTSNVPPFQDALTRAVPGSVSETNVAL